MTAIVETTGREMKLIGFKDFQQAIENIGGPRFAERETKAKGQIQVQSRRRQRS